MSSFDNREKNFENKFAHEEEVRFKIASRRSKLLGLWAAEQMGMGDEESLNYAREIINYGIENNSPDALVKKIMADANKKGIELAEINIKTKNSELELLATKQVLEEKK